VSEWWRSAVVYQIYVRSFADSDGDGIGDLPGIRSRLPYLRDLGVDGIWLTPFYPSPDADHGYDVSDYTDVDPRFGTLADFAGLVADAHDLGLRVVVDIVPNHTSSEHPWFVNALSRPDHPDRARYFFRPGRDGGPPNNWSSAFGGSAWTLDGASGEYYLHFFAPEQPDLDWHTPQVQSDFEDVLRFWLDRGVDGFRIDVAQALFKAQDLHDMQEPVPRPRFADWVTAVGQPELHPLYRRWRTIADGFPGERMFVGEIVLENQKTVASYVRADELQLAFNFAFLYAGWGAEALRETIDRTRDALAAVGAPATWVFENHDVVRLPTRHGGGELGRRRARAAALLLYALPGTAFVYQGQELGLEEVELPDELRQDPIFFRTNGERVGRDGCRVPIPWEPDGPGLGFTTGRPWLPQPEEWAGKSVAA
jgi:alpha-glucosidase